jgi:hypothetical protein
VLQPWVLQVVRLLELAVPLALVLGGQSVIACPTWFCLHCHLRFELAEALPQSVVESPLVALRVLLAHLLALVVPRVLVLEVLSVTAYPTWFCLHCRLRFELAEGLPQPVVEWQRVALLAHLLVLVVPRVLVLGVLSVTAYPTWFCLHCRLHFVLAEGLLPQVAVSPLVLVVHLLASVVPRGLVLEVLSVTAYPTWFCLHCLQHWVLAEGLLPQVAVLPLVLVVHLLASVVPRVLVLGVLSETAYPT